MQDKTSKYSKLGVSARKEGVHKYVDSRNKGIIPNAFCQVFPDYDDASMCQLLHADGTGTKAQLAWLLQQQTADPTVYQKTIVDAIVMNLDDMMCVGCTDNFLMSMTLARSAAVVTDQVLQHLLIGFDNFAAAMSDFGINIQLAGGETEDVGDIVNSLLVDINAYNRLKRDELINTDDIAAGDHLIALKSTAGNGFGFNSGIGSNGLTLARHTLLNADVANQLGITNIQAGQWSGKYHLSHRIPSQYSVPEHTTLADLLLSPCNSYLPVIRHLRQEQNLQLKALIHLTGGSFSKLCKFGRDISYNIEDLHQVPTIFQLIQAEGDISDDEMHTVFNMGQRLIIACNAADSASLVNAINKFYISLGETQPVAKVVGNVSASKTKQVNITAAGKSINYK